MSLPVPTGASDYLVTLRTLTGQSNLLNIKSNIQKEIINVNVTPISEIKENLNKIEI